MATGATYLERKHNAADTNVCTYPGCELEPADGASMCIGHRDAERARKKASIARRRARAKAKGLCSRCARRPRAPSSKWGCPACIIELGVLKRSPNFVARHVDKLQRIRDRTVVSVHGGEEGRSRYRGILGRRGRGKRVHEDTEDLNDARDAVEKAIAGLAFAASPEVQALPAIQRKEAVQAALSQADHAAGFIEVVLDRHRYRGRSARSDDEE